MPRKYLSTGLVNMDIYSISIDIHIYIYTYIHNTTREDSPWEDDSILSTILASNSLTVMFGMPPWCRDAIFHEDSSSFGLKKITFREGSFFLFLNLGLFGKLKENNYTTVAFRGTKPIFFFDTGVFLEGKIAIDIWKQMQLSVVSTVLITWIHFRRSGKT